MEALVKGFVLVGEMKSFGGIYNGKRVLVTGHTGFKGSWLSEWLLQLGAEVTGLSLPPATEPALFNQLGLAERMQHRLGDIRDIGVVERVIAECHPDYVFHLAAQPLVRLSYAQPVETFATNVLGTVHVLDALRRADLACSVVVVTTDKCYENHESGRAYSEEDALGGHDPYSSSKGAAEIAIAAYRRSYFSAKDCPVRLASARAGNVIGGGDWSCDRIVPDCIRALKQGEPIAVRNRVSTRPWQHVLEPLGGYLWLAANLARSDWVGGITAASAAFNFGPGDASNRTVAELVEQVLKYWPGRWVDRTDPKAVHEARLLSLDIRKVRRLLDWHPVWGFSETVAVTVDWYRTVNADAASAALLTRSQISHYTQHASREGLSWTK